MRSKLIHSWQRAGLLGSEAAAIQAQRAQILIRLLFTPAVVAYLAAHAPFFAQHALPCLTAAGVFIAINLAAWAWMRAAPWAVSRLLLLPLLDIGYTAASMWVDGGHTSPVYLVLYVVILSNAMRFGNTMLLYTQGLSFLAVGAVCVLSYNDPRLSLDWPWLILQLAGLAFVPAYVHVIGRRLEQAVTRRKAAETESVPLLDGMPVPAFIYAPDEHGELRIVHANPAIGAISAWTPRTLTGHFVDAVAAPEDGAEMRARCAEALDGGPGVARRFFIRGKDAEGEQRRLQCQAMTIHWQGGEAGLCLITDITETEQLQEQLDDAHRAGYVSSMVAGLAHDFRNILTHIIGNAEVMQLEGRDATLQRNLEVIIEAAERGADMITNLLDISRPRGVPPKRFQLRDTLPGILNLARVKLPANIRLDCRMADDLPPLLGQPAQIDQVVLNLVDNAAHAIDGDEGEIVIEAETVREHPLENRDSPAIRISVRDTGQGIPEDELPNIFKPFWTSRAEEGGTGLGMAMVRRIVEWHHGKVEAASRVGEGTTITIWLPSATPAAETDAAETAAPERTPSRRIERLEPWTILLVDDDPDVRHVQQTLLERLGQKVILAANGREGADTFRKRQDDIDLVITDFRMPGMNGLEMIRTIRAASPNAPILMITGYGEDVDLRECVHLHARLIHKPVTFQKLATEIGAIQMRAAERRQA